MNSKPYGAKTHPSCIIWQRIWRNCYAILILVTACQSRTFACGTFVPEMIDSTEFHRKLEIKGRLRERINDIIARGSASMKKCHGFSDSAAIRSCANALRPLRDSLKEYHDSVNRIIGIRYEYLYVTKTIDDTLCAQLDQSKPFFILYTKSHMAHIFYAVEIQPDSTVTKIEQFDSVDHDSGTRTKLFRAFAGRVNALDLDSLNSIIKANNIMEFKRYYSTDHHDGVQVSVIIEQDGWRKQIFLSNYRPKEILALQAIISSIGNKSIMTPVGYIEKLKSFNQIIYGRDVSKPYTTSQGNQNEVRVENPKTTIDPCEDAK